MVLWRQRHDRAQNTESLSRAKLVCYSCRYECRCYLRCRRKPEVDQTQGETLLDAVTPESLIAKCSTQPGSGCTLELILCLFLNACFQLCT